MTIHRTISRIILGMGLSLMSLLALNSPVRAVTGKDVGGGVWEFNCFPKPPVRSSVEECPKGERLYPLICCFDTLTISPSSTWIGNRVLCLNVLAFEKGENPIDVLKKAKDFPKKSIYYFADSDPHTEAIRHEILDDIETLYYFDSDPHTEAICHEILDDIETPCNIVFRQEDKSGYRRLLPGASMVPAPPLYALGSMQSIDEYKALGKAEKSIVYYYKAGKLHINHWVVVTPYLSSVKKEIGGVLTGACMIRTQFPEKGLSRELREFYEKFEYHVTKYTPTELKNYRMHKGLYPVIDLDLEKESAVILYAASLGTYPEDHPGFKCSVQFRGKEESEGFFTPDTAEKISKARQSGEPPVIYLVGRYDAKQKVFIAEKWMEEAQIISDIKALQQTDKNSKAPSQQGENINHEEVCSDIDKGDR